MDKLSSLLKELKRLVVGREVKKLSTTQNIIALIEVCTKCFKSTKKREQFILTAKHKEGANDVHIQVTCTGREGR